MRVLLLASLVVIVALVAFWKELARLGQLPARELPDRAGHLMVHAAVETRCAYAFATMVPAFAVFALYITWRDGNWGFGLYCFALCAIFGWPAALYVRRVRNRIELTEAGITQCRGTLRVFIPWAEVRKISEAPWPNALNIRGSNGLTLQLDKLLIGRPTVLEYMRAHLPPHLYQAAFSYLLPLTALRQRVRAGKRASL
ncbi:MAG TPA: hypothetical protein VGM84_23425 [Steroidobacteraceae bacterium]|jgi:hypothetical protein